MNTSSDIWFAFARTFSMLFLVLALLILAFYLIKKFSIVKGIKGGKDFIKVLGIHHLSPKEKLVLLDVLGDTILIGVTPSHICKISSFEKDKDIDISNDKNATGFKFSEFLTQKIGSSLKDKGKDNEN
jgi:flagellar protein FliO/FliZ